MGGAESHVTGAHSVRGLPWHGDEEHIGSLGAQGEVVRLDGVDGVAILVVVDLHHARLNFPTNVLDHVVETEGFAKMVARLGAHTHSMLVLHVSHK